MRILDKVAERQASIRKNHLVELKARKAFLQAQQAELKEVHKVRAEVERLEKEAALLQREERESKGVGKALKFLRERREERLEREATMAKKTKSTATEERGILNLGDGSRIFKGFDKL